MSNEIIHNANFKSRARLLPQLGDMLIKSEDIAFLELVKNSYDAGATLTTVLMDSIDNPEKGIILIEDNGIGMDADTIQNVWLELGSDHKVGVFEEIKGLPKAERGRIPIGEKGIGRLGAHKLGNEIELISKKVGENEVYVKINWRDFDEERKKRGEEQQKKYIEDISIKVVERKVPKHFIKEGASGTFISISDLKFSWTRMKIRNIQRTLTSISSPFKKSNEEFNVNLKVLDKPGWLNDIITWENIKDMALYKFEAVLNKSEIESFNYDFVPYKIFDNIEPTHRKYAIDTPEENDPLIVSNHTLNRKDENNKKTTINLSKDKIGTIKIEGYVFDLESYVLREVFDRQGLKEYLKANSGIKVFRDELRVYNYGEPDNDWLDLNLKRVNSPGEKISNNIIVCGVFLDRESSVGLEEKTNREGFIENDHFFDFKDSISHVIELVELLRKSDKKELRDKYGPTKKSEPVLSSIGALQKYVDTKVTDPVVAKEINSHLSDIESSYKIMQDRLLKTSSAGLGLGIVLHEVEKVIKELYEIVTNEPSTLRNVLSLVQRLSRLIKGYSEMFSKSVTKIVNCEELIEEALFSVEFRLKKHEVEVIKNFEMGKTPSLKVSKGLVEGVIINLIDNSLYWLDIALEEHKSIISKKLFIDVVDEGDSVEIVIADNGTGFLIPTDKIIEPMETGKKAGLGLGLHIAHEIMLSQNGSVLFPDFSDYEIPEEFRKGALVVLKFSK